MGNSCQAICGSKKPKVPASTVKKTRRGSFVDESLKAGSFTAASTMNYKRISTKYKFTEKILGAGNFGKVFLAESVADSEFKVAIKTI